MTRTLGLPSRAAPGDLHTVAAWSRVQGARSTAPCSLARVWWCFGLPASVPPQSGCVLCVLMYFLVFGTFCGAIDFFFPLEDNACSAPQPPQRFFRIYGQVTLSFHSFSKSLQLWACSSAGSWEMGTWQGRQVTKQANAVTEPSDAVTRQPRKPWKCGTGPAAVRGGFLEEVVSALKPEGPRRSQ